MFGNCSSDTAPSSSSSPSADPSLPTTSSAASPSASSSSLLLVPHHIPSSSSIFGSSSSVIVPSSVVHHHQLGHSPSLPPMPSIEQQSQCLFTPNQLIAHLIAISLRPYLSQPQPIHPQQDLFLSDLLQNTMIAERLHQNSSTPSSAMAGLSFHSTTRTADNNNGENGGNTGGTATAPNGAVVVHGDQQQQFQPSNNPQQQPSMPPPSLPHHSLLPSPSSAPPPISLQKSLSVFDLLQMQSIAMAASQQQQSKMIGGFGAVPTNGFQQPSQQTMNGCCRTTTPNTLELLNLLSIHQQQHSTTNSFNTANFPNFASGISACSSSDSSTSQRQNCESQKDNSKCTNGPEPMDLTHQQQQPPRVLFNRTDPTASGNVLPPPLLTTRKPCDIRRSASSVSSYKVSADVHEHFQRTFSGKWPRRQPSLRSHLPASGGRATAAIGESTPEAEAADETAASEGRKRSCAKAPAGDVPPPGRPKSRQPVKKSVYNAVIRKLFTASNEVKQVEDHFRKSLGDDRFQQIQSEQQRKREEEAMKGVEEKAEADIVRDCDKP